MCDHLWFDYRIWCILFQINVQKINSITKFIRNYVNNNDFNFNYYESKFFELESNNQNYKLIRDDARRFRPNLDLNKINYPEIPREFYGVDNIDEFILEITGNDNFGNDFSELFQEFENDNFPYLSRINLIDRVVIVTIIVCEYFECSYLQGMHDIVGCLSFLKTQPFPITFHILLAMEIILKWGRFLLLPSLFEYNESFEFKNIVNSSEYVDFKTNSQQEYENIDNIFGFICDIFIGDDKTFKEHEIDYSPPNEHGIFNEYTNERRTSRVNKIKTFNLKFKNKVNSYEKIGNHFQCTIKQIIDICNEFQMFGNFHAPLIFNKIERTIESNTWCCGIFITCGSSLFIEIQNVLLFWLNLLFCSTSSPYKPPYYPHIENPLQIPAFLVTMLKAYEHNLKDDIHFICTEEFKFDSQINLHIGIANILQPFLIISDNKKDISDENTAEYIEEEKRPIFVDLFQIILALNHIIVSTPLSLQERLINTIYYFSSRNTNPSNGIINCIDPSEFILYDSIFFNKRISDNFPTIITGKDIVIIDILSSFYIEDIIENHFEEFIDKLKLFEKTVCHEKFKNLENVTDEVTSVLLLPILRSYLRTIRIVKIPVNKRSNLKQVTKQFIEFSSRRQNALLVQKRPSIWIVLGPKDEITDSLILTLIEKGIIGLQLINPLSLMNEVICNDNSNSMNHFIQITVKEVIDNLIIGNLPENRNKAPLKSRIQVKKNLTASLKSTGEFSEPKNLGEKSHVEQIQCHDNNPEIPKKMLNTGTKLIKFRPNIKKKNH